MFKKSLFNFLRRREQSCGGGGRDSPNSGRFQEFLRRDATGNRRRHDRRLCAALRRESSEGGYLLLSDSTGDAVTQYPVRRILEKMAQSPALRKLLILDSTRIASQLELGLLGNDFIENVKSDFQAVDQRPFRERKFLGSFLLSDAGQQLGHLVLWVIPSLASPWPMPFGVDHGRYRRRSWTDRWYLSGRRRSPISFNNVWLMGSSVFGMVRLINTLCLKYGPDFKLIRADDRLNRRPTSPGIGF